MKKLIVIFLLATLFGCITKKAVTTKESDIQSTVSNLKETNDEVEKSTTYQGFPSDSASVKALFVCDSLYNVILLELETERGRKLSPEVSWKDNYLYIKVVQPIDSAKVYSEYKSKHEVAESDSTDTKAQSQSTEVKVKSNWYMKFSSWIVSLLIIAALVYVIWKFKLYKLILK